MMTVGCMHRLSCMSSLQPCMAMQPSVDTSDNKITLASPHVGVSNSDCTLGGAATHVGFAWRRRPHARSGGLSFPRPRFLQTFVSRSAAARATRLRSVPVQILHREPRKHHVSGRPNHAAAGAQTFSVVAVPRSNRAARNAYARKNK